MGEHEMFKTTLMGGYDKEEVQELIQKMKDEMAEVQVNYRKQLAERDAKIAELQKRIELKDASQAKMEEDIKEKYQKYIDNYVPQPYNEHYNLAEQGVMADYVFLMAYDEHVDGSYEAGSVASLPFVKEGIEKTLQEVPKEKVINGIPFYTRLWTESNNGTLSSEVMTMDQAIQYVQENGIEVYWEKETAQNYGELLTDSGTQKIWIEDEQSIEEKMKLIEQYGLAGVASWKLGFERADVWSVISQYLQ